MPNNKIGEIKKILEQHSFNQNGWNVLPTGNFPEVAQKICQLFPETKENPNELKDAIERLRKVKDAAFAEEKADFGLSVYEAAVAQTETECQTKMEKLFKEITRHFEERGYNSEEEFNWWQSTKQEAENGRIQKQAC